jgi:Bacterial Ig domain/Calcineurin-like phosphoesterase/Immunoglobulin domain/Fibronectin type III domain
MKTPNRQRLAWLLPVLALLNPMPLMADSGPPANDDFDNAIPLTGPIVTATGSNVGATKQFPGEPFISGNFGGASVWWTWTATASGETTVDTSGSDFNTLLGVYTGTAVNQLTTVAANNDYEGNQWSRVQFMAEAGTEYKIVVDGFATGRFPPQPARGNIVLHLKGVGGLNIDSPTNGMVFTFGDPIPIDVSFTSDFPNPPATRVDFYRGDTLFASSTTEPFSAMATDVPAGSNSFYVVAINSAGLPVQSPVVNVLVQNVGVTLLTPFEDTLYFDPSPITVTAWPYLPAGAITNIEFYVDNVKFGEAATPPYSAVWSEVTGGSHRFTAIGRSDTGTSYDSQPVNVGVVTAILPYNSVWSYLDDGSDQGTNWLAPDFDAGSWASGPAPLGYGDSNGRLPATTNAFGPDPNNKFVTTYFRQTFQAANVSGYSDLVLNIQRDDGAIVYLNGTEVGRFNMPAGMVTSTTFAAGNASDDGGTTFSISMDPALLHEGANVFAVEIHQDAGNSSDIWFQMELVGVPIIIHNLSPAVELTGPAKDAFYLNPPSVMLEASASDEDGSVVKVEFFADGVKVGEDADEPYQYAWTTPPVGAHALTAVATDNLGATTVSEPVPIVVYDAAGTPVAQIISPADGAVMEGPTNLLLTATAHALTGVTNVQFLANGEVIGDATTSPYTVIWPSTFLSNQLVAVAFDASGVRGTSPVVNVFITIPPTNTVAPTIATQIPIRDSDVVNYLTNITVIFSERVQNVDAGDLLINGIAAASVTGTGSNYTFHFPQPPYGDVEVAIAAGHGITDYGFPSDLPYNELSPDGRWEYNLMDQIPPTLIAHTPESGVTVTNLTQVSVTFSEPVTGVDAQDLLVAGTPAYDVTGSDADYTFSVSQPASGSVNVTWAANHGITDLAEIPNPFNGTGPGARWTLTLDARATLVQSNSNWLFIKGRAEASEPTDAWRQLAFDDSGWSNAPAPFFFGDAYSNGVPAFTLLSDMLGQYSTIYLRKEFTVPSRNAITTLLLNAQSDDGFVAWINGVEVLRYNVPEGELAYNATASAASPESGTAGALYIVHELTNAASALVNGTNVLAIHAINQFITSSDFGFNAELYAFLNDHGFRAPVVAKTDPPQGDVVYLTNVMVTFSEEVSGVQAADLLVNGVPADTVTTTDQTSYDFGFERPAFGPVTVTWAQDQTIEDLDDPPKPFNGSLASSILHYTLINPENPRIVSQSPPAGATLTNLTQITVAFTKPVTGVEAADLLLNGVAAEAVTSDDPALYTFTFPQPPYGNVAVRWAANHGIQDAADPANVFDPTRFGGQWDYTLLDPIPSVVMTSPENGSYVLAPATVVLRATASDNDGTVDLVEFFEGTNKLGEGTNAPYFLTVSDLAEGAYVFRAVATDNTGIMATSAPVTVMVVTNLPVTLARGPYLQVGTPTSGVVRWRTDLFSDALVHYGTDPANLTNDAVQTFSTNEHIVPISGLEPDTQYYYSIGSSAQTLAIGTNFWFRTSPVPGTPKPTRFWVLGDSGTANQNARAVRDAFYDYAATNGPADLWLMLGDNAYNSGQDTEYQQAVFDMYPSMLRNRFLWPVIGNHESNQSFTANDFPYLHIFTLPENGEAGGVPSGSQKYYSFDYANIHFIGLDSMTSGRDTNSAMVQWLVMDLQASSADWNIVFFHHPPYTKGSHDSDRETELIEIRQNILPILEANGVDLVLCGHSHVHERSYLLNGHYGVSSTFTSAMKIDGGDGREDGDGAYRKNALGQGVVYSVSGSSGQTGGGSLNHPAHFISLNELGSMVIDVNSNRLDAIFLTGNERTSDHFTLLKRSLDVPAAPQNLIATALDTNLIRLSWTDLATNETGFVLERSLDGTNFVEALTAEPDATNALDGGLLANTTYYYRVHAVNEFGDSDLSPVSSATTVVPGGTPLAPSDLVASADNGVEFYRSQIILRWRDASAEESGYVIERSLDGAAFTQVGTVGANVTHYVDRGLDSATLYYYRVRGLAGTFLSSPSNLAFEQTHPQSQVVAVGATATFHAGVEGQPSVRYQWRFEDTPIFGATNETFTVQAVMPWDEGAYNVAITDTTGPLLGNPAYLFVLSAPLITSQPAGTTNLVGDTVTFTVGAVGDEPLWYQWRRDGVPISGAIEATLTLEGVALSDQGDYDVVVENDFGSEISHLARLSVNQPPFALADTVYRFAGETLAVDVASLLANDGDPDGEPISLAGLADHSQHGGTVEILGRYVFYAPPEGFDDPDTFTYTITDPRGGTASALVTIEISSNTAPSIQPIPDVIASVLTPVVIQNVASDSNVPSDNLAYALGSGAPANAYLDTNEGLFIWTPTRDQAPATNAITLKVTDDGKPPLSAAKTFTVVVRDYVEVTAGSAVLQTGEEGTVALQVFSSAGLTQLQFALHYPEGLLNDLTVEALAPLLTALSLQTTGPGSAVLTCGASPNQPLQGPQTLARLRFTVAAGQPSAFAALEVSDLNCTRATEGLLPSALLNPGRLTVVGDQPLLEIRPGTAGGTDLVLYGKNGVLYNLESSPHLGEAAAWTLWRQVTLTSLPHVEALPNPMEAGTFYRAREGN